MILSVCRSVKLFCIRRTPVLLHLITAAGLVLFSGHASLQASPRVWVSGVPYQAPAGIPNLPVSSSTQDWIEFGELSGNPADSTALIDGRVMLIDQQTGKVILNWESFDIAEGYEVRFVQPEDTSVALNKVDANASPSHILGRLSANGGIYLINPNGILFGPESEVNLGSLLASTLDVDNQLFIDSSITQAINQGDNGLPALSAAAVNGARVLRLDDNGIPQLVDNSTAQPGDIVILEGAELQTTTLNGVVAVAPNILNEGRIQTPGGQTVLAAAQDEAFLVFSDDPGLRGLLVEVETGGDVTNLGEIIAERGNVTLAGMAVNQEGRITATTSVDFNGSIRLIARDTLERDDTGAGNVNVVSALLDEKPALSNIENSNLTRNRIAQQAGEVRFGRNSVTEVLPELASDVTAPDAQAQLLSGVEVVGETITLQQNARITASGGEVFLHAVSAPDQAFDENNNFNYNAVNLDDRDLTGSRILLESGSLIDVSGAEVVLPAERNVVELELRGNELADSPRQRDGILDGATVRVDVRRGTPIANIEPALASIPRTVAERLTTGGSVVLRSEGEVIQQPDSLIDVSGGNTHYESGFIQTTKLVSEGQVYDIGDADPNRIYDGLLGEAFKFHERWNITENFQNTFLNSSRGEFVEAYDQGAAAGSVFIQTQAAFLQGDIKADTIAGPFQRQPGAGNFPLGGLFQLSLNLQGINISQAADSVAFDINQRLLQGPNNPAGPGLNPQELRAIDVQLSEAQFNDSGVSRFVIESRNYAVTIAEGTELSLPAGSMLDVTAAAGITMDGAIRSPGGTVSFETVENVSMGGQFYVDVNGPDFVLNKPVTLGANALIDTRGLWVNDAPLLNEALGLGRPDTPLWIDGGEVNLDARGDLILTAGSLIDSSGGGWLDANGDITAGTGGDISLSAVERRQENIANVQGVELRLDGDIRSFAFYRGGTLSLTAPSVFITDGDASGAPGNALVLDSVFFRSGGFSAYDVSASASSQASSVFTVAGDADIRLQAENFLLPEVFGSTNNGPLVALSGSNAEGGLISQDLALLPTGADLSQAVSRGILPDDQRLPVDIAFTLNNSPDPSLVPGAQESLLRFDTGARIITDAGASVEMLANTSLFLNGVIEAPAGRISLSLFDTSSGEPYQTNNIDDVGIWLGADSRLSTASVFIPEPDPLGLRRGQALDAGSVELSVNRGFIIAEQGATIDVSADVYTTDAFVPLPFGIGAGIQEQQVTADAGTISLTAAEGILFDGEFIADAYKPGGAAGGELLIALDPSARSVPAADTNSPPIDFNFPGISFTGRDIILRENVNQPLIPSGLDAAAFGRDDSIPEQLNGVAVFDTARLSEAGFDSYGFTSVFTAQPSLAQQAQGAVASSGAGQIIFEGDVVLGARERIGLNATSIAAQDGRALVTAPYISIGFDDPDQSGTPAETVTEEISGGHGELVFLASAPESLVGQPALDIYAQLDGQATTDLLSALQNPEANGLIDLIGNVSTQGADQVIIASGGDIRTRGILSGGQGDDARFLGRFETFGDLTLQADQVYPATLSEYILATGQRRLTDFIVPDPDNPSNTLVLPTTSAEAYDFLAGVLFEGGTFTRVETIDNVPTDVERQIVGVVESVFGNPDATLTILPGSGGTPLLSAGGRLILDSPNIEHAGVLKAPLGRVVFNARPQSGEGSVTILPGSLTSVSAEDQIIPFGEIDGVGDWVYLPSPGESGIGLRLFDQASGGAPEKNVLINSSNIDLQSGAGIDLSGGGDLLAYQFIPGPGGSQDVLSLANAGESFAILPGLDPGYAPFDANSYSDFTVPDANATDIFRFASRPGDSVFLNGAGDLPAGEYAVLPPRYALLPGAFLITPVPDSSGLQAGRSLRRLDGAPVVAGRFTVTNSGIQDSLLSGFIVESGETVGTRSEYEVSLANTFFADQGDELNLSIPNDAGSLTLLAERSLNIEADFISTVGEQGRGSRLDISSDELAVVNRFDSSSSAVQILDTQLSSINVESILLGGRRSLDQAGTRINVQTRQVTVAENAQVSAPSITLAATQQVQVESGARLIAAGDVASQGQNLTLIDSGALLRVSAGEQVTFTNQAAGSTMGDLMLSENAQVVVDDGSVLFFSTNNTEINGDILMDGGSLNIGAGLVSLGEVENVSQGLVFDNQDLAALSVDELILTSTGSIDLYGNIDLSFSDVELVAESLIGFGDAGDIATLAAANRLTLSSPVQVSGDTAPVVNGTGTGALNISANELVLGAGEFGVAGFERVGFTGTGAVVGDGRGRFTIVGNNEFSLQTPLITATGGASTQLRSDGLLTVAALGSLPGNAGNDFNQGLGARIALSGDALSYSGTTELASGQLSLEATGINGDLLVQSGALIDTSGRAIQFDDINVASRGGIASFRSAQGDIIIESGATINVSGVEGENGGDAGAVSLEALQGQVTLAGELLAAAGDNARGGRFSLQLDQLGDFAALNDQVQAGNFTEAFILRLGNGDLNIAATDIIAARAVTLTTDNGGITLGGTIDAAGAEAGRVNLNSNGDLVLAAGSRILANAQTTGETGGSVFLSSTGGGLILDDNALINVSGGDGMADGQVHFRVSRTNAGLPLVIDNVNGGSLNGIAGDGVATLSATPAFFANAIQGAERIDVEAFKVYADPAQVDQALMNSIRNETIAFMNNADSLETALFGVFDRNDRFHLQAGIEIRSGSDLTVTDPIDFGEGLGGEFDIFGNMGGDPEVTGSAWRFNEALATETVGGVDFEFFSNGEAGFFTLRTEGDLNINASVSDGFADVFSTTAFANVQELKNEQSGWSYRLIGGADLASADLLATAVNGTGGLSLANDVILRSSTGDIDIAAAGDVSFGNNAVLYAAGRDTGAGSFDAWVAAQAFPFDQVDNSVIAGATYPEDGGDIRLYAGGNITGSDSQQFFAAWLQRIGSATDGIGGVFADTTPTTWTIVPEDFRQDIASFGGGNITIESAGDIVNLSVSAPTTGKQAGQIEDPTATVARFITNEVLVQGGGDLSVTAGNDILSGRFLLGQGEARIRAGGDIIAAEAGQDTVLALAEGSYALNAGGSIDIASVFNPTLLRPSTLQQGRGSNIALREVQSHFFTYSEDSAAAFTALSGDIRFANRVNVPANPSVFGVDASDLRSFVSEYYPGTVEATALQGNIELLGRQMNLFPSAQGGVSFLAAGSVSSVTDTVINISDADINFLPNISNPLNIVTSAQVGFSTSIESAFSLVDDDTRFNEKLIIHAPTPVHINDREPVRFVARDGDVSGFQLFSPKQTLVTAGRDISDVNFEFQHVDLRDISVLQAGRDIVFETPRQRNTNLLQNAGSDLGIEIGGPGRLDLIAGRDVALGTSGGVRSIGNFNNPNLLTALGFGPESGADISVLAGIGGVAEYAEYAGFAENYLAPFVEPAGFDNSGQLIDFVLSGAFQGDLVAFVSDETRVDYRGQSEDPLAAAREDMRSLPLFTQQKIAFQAVSVRRDNYAGDLIEFVTSERFAGNIAAAVETQLAQNGNPVSVSGRQQAIDILSGMSLTEQHAIALAAYNAAPVNAQRELVLQAYFNEIRQGGVEDLTGAIDDPTRDGFPRSFAAIQTLFPASADNGSAYQGDIGLVFSTIQTQQGGDINLLAPGGGIDVGLAAGGSSISKDASELGVIALRIGDINAAVDNDINVNRARVFALDGGDILLWSSAGNIDAGRGPQTALSIPPPRVTEQGIDFQAAVAGSGIRNSRFTAERAPGGVFLFAPGGIVDAGDAGIGSQGDVLIAAQEVLGADNIDVGGISIGVPVATGVSASLAAASTAGTTASDSAEDSVSGDLAEGQLDDQGVAFVTVEVIGLGE